MKNVSLVWATPNGDALIANMARVSNPANQDNPNSAGLISYLIKHKHWSPFEMVGAALEINTTRDIGRQILRHRSFFFQEFCIAGDSLITTSTRSGKVKRIPIADLYKRYQSERYWSASDNLVRVFNEADGLLKAVKIKEVFETGVKPVYMLTLDNGRKIKSTAEHKFLTRTGFKPLSDISIYDFVGSNGAPAYQEFDWMSRAKESCIKDGTGVQGIADRAGISYHTARKWLKKLGLQFSKLEVATYTTIWNKGLDSSLQPMFGKTHSDETRVKMHESSLKGMDSALYTTGGNAFRGFRRKVADYWGKRKLALYRANGGVCDVSGASCEINDLEVDHVQPVSKFPELAYDKGNIQLIHKDLHAKKTQSEVAIRSMTITWQKVASIEYVGEEQTYDMEVDHPSHNYVANGIVTHNSQRYADVSMLGGMAEREVRLQDSKNRQNSIEVKDQPWREKSWADTQNKVWSVAFEAYQGALACGVAKEVARALLPEGLTPSRMYMHGTLRSWMHFIEVRSGPETQKEHREIAAQAREILSDAFPLVMGAASLNIQ